MISTEQKFLLNRMNSVAGKTQLGDLLDATPSCVKLTYDVAVNGGAIGSHDLIADINKLLPVGAVVLNTLLDIITPFVSTGGSGTLSLTMQSAADLLAAVDADTLANRVQGIPNNSAANSIKLTAARNVSAVVAGQDLTAGKADIYVTYVK